MKEDTANGETKEKKPRHRSPSYPTIGLREAVDRLKKFNGIDGKAGAPPEIAVKHMGYSTAHGSAMSALSAMKKFGLVAENNGRIVPTQRALEIINLPDADPRRTEALASAAASPSIYRELMAENKNGLPSADALESELITYRSFNPNAVKGFVKDFQDSLEFAGLSDFSGLNLELGDDTAMPQASTDEQNVPGYGKSLSSVSHQAAPNTKQQLISTPVGTEDGRVIFAQVSFDSGLRKEFVTSLKKYLDYLETTLQ